MLELKVSEKELFNDDEGTFVAVAAQTLELEHSLISVSKWESKWRKPFLIEGKHDPEAYVDYIRCMCIRKNFTSGKICVGILKSAEKKKKNAVYECF